MKVLTTIQRQPIFFDEAKGIVTFLADADIDNDGSGGNVGNDPYHQSETSLKQDGKSLNSQTECFIVVPLGLPLLTKGEYLGAQAEVYNHRTGKSAVAVVGDLGPAAKIGEISVALAKALGVNPDPVRGGESEFVLSYSIRPGVPAVANGKTYKLQPYRR